MQKFNLNLTVFKNKERLLRGRCGFDSRREYQRRTPCFCRGCAFGISIGEDQPRRARRFVPTQSARGRSPKYSRREYQGRAPANAGARPWYFNRGGPAARRAAVRPDAVGTRAQPEVFPPGVPKNRLIENKIKRFFYAFLHFKISFLCPFHLQEIEILFVLFQSFKAEPLHFGFYVPEFSHSVGFVRVKYSFLIRRFKGFCGLFFG